VEELDAGPIFTRRQTDIGIDDDAESLFERLISLGLEALGEALDSAAGGRLLREPQAGESSLAPRIRRQDARLSFAMSAAQIHNLVRAFKLWPTAYFELKPPASGLLRVLRTRPAVPSELAASGGGPGSVLSIERQGGILVQCGDRGGIWLLTVQPEGKKPVCAADFLNGLRLGVGSVLPLAL
jgi:methionyl-tRNA formyltransferase